MTFQWLVGASSLCLLIGSVLLLWGLKVAPVSSPFNSLVRDLPENAERGPGPITREHPWAVRRGAIPRRSRAPSSRGSHQTVGGRRRRK
jgi:hypothetical protein